MDISAARLLALKNIKQSEATLIFFNAKIHLGLDVLIALPYLCNVDDKKNPSAWSINRSNISFSRSASG